MGGITFRGSRDGLRVRLGDDEWQSTLLELAAQLSRPSTQSFFRGARVLLETGDRSIGIAELEKVIELFGQHQMELVTVVGTPAAEEALAQLRGKPETPSPEVDATDGDMAGDSLVIRRTIRSGQVIRHPGTVVVLGDVNPGGEVIADGDVIVWGKLRGVVHAGAGGDNSATVGALVLMPTQLRIGTLIARAPEESTNHNPPAEIARVKDGNIFVEPWHG